MTKVVSTDDMRAMAVCTVITVLLFLSGFLVLFTPLPTLYVFLKKGRSLGIATSALALVVIGALYILVLPWMGERIASGQALFFALPGIGLMDHFSIGRVQCFGGSYFIFFMTVAIALGEGAIKGYALRRWVGSSIVAGIGIVFLLALFAQVFSGASLVSGISNYVQSVIAEIAKLNESAGISSAQTQYLATHGTEVASLIVSLLPSIVFVFVLLAVVLNMLVGRRFVKIPHAIARTRETINFRLQDYWIWALVMAGIIFFTDQYILQAGWLKLISINVLIAMGALYFFQGFAVVSFFLERIKMRMIRLLGYISIILFFQFAAMMLVGLGIADVWIHFREKAHMMGKKKDEF